jgi:uncharacterized protein DUF2783
MAHLNLQPNFHADGQRYFRAYSPGDDFYQLLIDSHRDLSDEQSAMLNAQLILLLANHVGDLEVLREALHHARAGVTPGGREGVAPGAREGVAPGAREGVAASAREGR